MICWSDIENLEERKTALKQHVERLSDLQNLLYASNRYAVLLIFQAMDAAGKDGVIRHVMSGVNPQGCQVFSFKHPSASELAHDFLWRTTRDLPERGKIGIFNRSYYEEVLVARVHPEILKSERIPPALVTKNIWEERYQDINNFELHLNRNGTIILKFYLNISFDEQKKRLLKRIDDPKKNWKFSPNDIKERVFWKQYREAYEDAVSNTSTEIAPWYAIPADHKWFARIAIADVIVAKLKSLKLQYPTLKPDQLAELKRVKKILEKQ